MSVAVFDASVVVKWYLAEDPLAAQALEVRLAFEGAAPTLILAEAANALWRYVRLNRMDIDDVCEGVAVIGEGLRLTSDADLIDAAQRLSARLDHPVYDCLYLALAQRLDAPLVTADRKLAEKAQAVGLAAILLQTRS